MPDKQTAAKNTPRKVSPYTASFMERSMERAYLVHEYGRVGKYLRIFLAAGAFLYFAFIIPDYLTLERGASLYAVLALRALFVLVTLVTLSALNNEKNLPRMHWWMSAYTVLNSLNFVGILWLYRSENHYLQAFSVILVVLAIFLIPNRWVLSTAAAALVIASYVALLAAHAANLTGMESVAVALYLFITVAIGAFSSLRRDYSMRIQYLATRDLERMTVTDALTGIANRKRFDEDLSRWIMLAFRYHGPFSLVLLDLDDFKTVNDRFGHYAGDAVLTGISMLVTTMIREMDLFARWGGEEFVLLLPQTEREHAAVLADRIRARIAEHQFPGIGRVTCSFGVTEYIPEDSVESIFIRVDGLMYRAKSQGKNRVVSG